MLSITHAAIGGAAGTVVINPTLGFILGILSHLIVDKIPHFWPQKDTHKLIQIIIDAIGSFFMLYFIYVLVKQNIFSPIFWGATGGVFVDFMLVLVFKIHPKLWNSKLRTWHEKRQPHKSNFVYLLTDIIQIIIGLMIIKGF